MEVPFTRFEGRLAASKVALVTTGGVHLPAQERFDIDDFLGDCSYREIPSDAGELTWTHYYHAPERRSDLDSVFPLWTMRGLLEEGVIGSLGRRHFSFMGAIHDAGLLIEQTAPEVARKLIEDGVDAAFLTPSCPLCHRSVALLAQEIERAGVPTVAVAMEDGVAAPRVARVGFPYNFPMGEPEDGERHREVALAALSLLEELEAPGTRTLDFEWRG